MFDRPRHRYVIVVMALLAPAVACQGGARSGLPGSGGGPGASGGATGASPDGSTVDVGGGADARASGGAGASVGSGGSSTGSGGGGGGSAGRGGTGGALVLNCVSGSAPRVPVTPFRRLSNVEYNNTVRDIFGDTSRPADALPYDGAWGDWASTTGPSISSLLAEGYFRLAHEQAARATIDAASVRAVAGCDYVAGEAACRQTFLEAFLPVVLRRPLSMDDRADFAAVFSQGRELTGDFAGGVRAVIEVALQSPEFLYRVEFAEPVDKTAPAARLTPFELATRLSYFLWASTPDAMLRDAAARGELQTKEQVALQARRLLADTRAREVVRGFYRQLFNLRTDTLAGLVSSSASATFTAELPALLMKETEAFIDEVTWKGAGDLRTLLTAPYTFANARLGQHYGISGVTGDALQKVTLPASQRAGLLTQGSLLASTSHPSGTSPVMRGMSIFQRVMCGTVQPPPPDVGVPVPVTVPATATTRERHMLHLADPQCQGCHQDLDPLGFAFEHFDQYGAWRDTENGKPIDATGEIFTTDAKGTFNGALELIARLAASQDVQNCYANNWMMFAFARRLAAEDGCSVQSLHEAFARAKGSIPELLVALTQTDAFLYKATP
jgi:hypothetical protein